MVGLYSGDRGRIRSPSRVAAPSDACRPRPIAERVSTAASLRLQPPLFFRHKRGYFWIGVQKHPDFIGKTLHISDLPGDWRSASAGWLFTANRGAKPPNRGETGEGARRNPSWFSTPILTPAACSLRPEDCYHRFMARRGQAAVPGDIRRENDRELRSRPSAASLSIFVTRTYLLLDTQVDHSRP